MEEILSTHSVILYNLFRNKLKLNANKNYTWNCSNKLKTNRTQSSKEIITIEQNC